MNEVKQKKTNQNRNLLDLDKNLTLQESLFYNKHDGRFNLCTLKRAGMSELRLKAAQYNIDCAALSSKQDIIMEILRLESEKGDVVAAGVLEIHSDGYGFLREPRYSYSPSVDDIYVPPSIIRAQGLRVGDSVYGQIRPPTDRERYYSLIKLETINGLNCAEHRKNKVYFDNLTPLYSKDKFQFETTPTNFSTRIIDLFCPIGKGQRALIVSPPRAGKTILIQDIAKALTQNYPDVVLFILLIDERPEEVTDIRSNVKAEVIASTFDEQPQRHVQVAEITIEKAKRLVELKYDVVILLDNITRLGRAYNTLSPSGGRTLSGGVDSNALQKPKRIFGAARNVQEGGSLTIISTALVDTGSRMDEVIFEEFKGTGNCEIVLDRKLMEKRLFPCMDVNKSATRKEELLLSKKAVSQVYEMRKSTYTMNPVEAMEYVNQCFRKFSKNQELIDAKSNTFNR